MQIPSGEVILGRVALASQNDRRTIEAFNCPDGDLNFQSFDLFRSAPGGNHYHERTAEIFMLTSGQGFYRFQAMGRDGKPVGNIIEHFVTPGSVWVVPPFMAHTSVFTPHSTMVCLQTRAFDPEDPDSVTVVLITEDEVPSILAKMDA